MSGEPSLEDVRYALNVAGLSPRSHAYADLYGGSIVKVQTPLIINGGTQIPRGADGDIQRELAYLIDKIVWEENSTGNWQLAFSGNGIAITVGADVLLPEGHNIHSDNHYPLIHQGNDDGRAERVYAECISGSTFNLLSIIKTFSWIPDKAIAELLRHGPGHEVIRINSREVYEDLLPHLAQAFPWVAEAFFMPYPLKDVDGWISRPILQEG